MSDPIIDKISAYDGKEDPTPYFEALRVEADAIGRDGTRLYTQGMVAGALLVAHALRWAVVDREGRESDIWRAMGRIREIAKEVKS